VLSANIFGLYEAERFQIDRALVGLGNRTCASIGSSECSSLRENVNF